MVIGRRLIVAITAVLIVLGIFYAVLPRVISVSNAEVASKTIFRYVDSWDAFKDKNKVQLDELIEAGVLYINEDGRHIQTGKCDDRLEILRKQFISENYQEFWIFGEIKDTTGIGFKTYESTDCGFSLQKGNESLYVPPEDVRKLEGWVDIDDGTEVMRVDYEPRSIPFLFRDHLIIGDRVLMKVSYYGPQFRALEIYVWFL